MFNPERSRTYRMTMPRATHFQRVTCEQAECEISRNGWVMRVEPGSKEEALIRKSGKRWSAIERDGGFLKFVFPPGTQCFKTHTEAIRPANFSIVNAGKVQRVTAEDWAGDYKQHTESLISEL